MMGENPNQILVDVAGHELNTKTTKTSYQPKLYTKFAFLRDAGAAVCTSNESLYGIPSPLCPGKTDHLGPKTDTPDQGSEGTEGNRENKPIFTSTPHWEGLQGGLVPTPKTSALTKRDRIGSCQAPKMEIAAGENRTTIAGALSTRIETGTGIPLEPIIEIFSGKSNFTYEINSQNTGKVQTTASPPTNNEALIESLESLAYGPTPTHNEVMYSEEEKCTDPLTPQLQKPLGQKDLNYTSPESGREAQRGKEPKEK